MLDLRQSTATRVIPSIPSLAMASRLPAPLLLSGRSLPQTSLTTQPHVSRCPFDWKRFGSRPTKRPFWALWLSPTLPSPRPLPAVSLWITGRPPRRLPLTTATRSALGKHRWVMIALPFPSSLLTRPTSSQRHSSSASAMPSTDRSTGTTTAALTFRSTSERSICP